MKGLIEAALANRVASNLFAMFILFAGFISVQALNVRIFPQVDLEAVSITVPYPGATPQEIETSVVQPLEERLEGLEGVDKITSLAAPNTANVVVDLEPSSNVGELLDEIKTEVDRITVFPEEAEEPQIVEFEVDELAAQIVLYGDVDTATLKAAADRVRSDIVDQPEVSFAEIGGAPEYLIEISVDQDTLQAYGLSLTDISRAISSESLDLSGGEIEDSTQRLLVRSTGERRRGAEFETIVVRSGATGTPVLLGDIATVRDGLAESPVISTFEGQPATYVSVYRVGDEKQLDVTNAVNRYLDTDIAGALPEGVSVEFWRDESILLRDRIDLLSRNALLGLALVALLLLSFLDLRIAFWVAFGVGVSFVGAFALMLVFGITINQLSLFGFILAIGIVVDDAIVVGENIHGAWRSGDSPMEAARRGVLRVSTPVLFSVSTTIVAFVPLLFVPGTFGQFLGPIAAVVIFVLLLSLFESFFVLPRHLSHLDNKPPSWWSPRRIADPYRDFVAARLRAFRDGPLRKVVTFFTLRPLMTVLIAFGIFFSSLSLATSGAVKFIFFPEVEGDYVTAELELSESASEVQTLRFAERIADAARDTAADMPGGADSLTGVLLSLGVPSQSDFSTAGPSGGAAANKAFVVARLAPPESRRYSAITFEDRWRELTGEIPGAQKLTFSSDLVSPTAPIQFDISTRNVEDTRAAVADLRAELAGQNGVFDIRDDRFRTTDEVQIEVKPLARSYGITQSDLAAEVRAAFFGAEAVRVQRDREEIEARVRLPVGQRGSLDTIKDLRIRVGDGFIPIESLAELSIAPAPATITRVDGRRVYKLTADVDTKVATPGAASAYILDTVAPRLAETYDGLAVRVAGDQEEQAQAGPAIARNFMLALVVIYCLLALNFRSYSQPLVVMMAIPFGFAGAIVGHWMLGLTMSLLSMFGVIGLSGVIINNALLMIDFVNERLQNGQDERTAVIEATLDRFRAILLTSLTTFLGVTPIIFETSVQAQFLIPTAVSLGFGILIGTAILILLIPSLGALHLRIFGHPNQGTVQGVQPQLAE